MKSRRAVCCSQTVQESKTLGWLRQSGSSSLCMFEVGNCCTILIHLIGQCTVPDTIAGQSVVMVCRHCVWTTIECIKWSLSVCLSVA